MSLFSWVNKGIARMNWFDVGLVKLASASFALLVAALFPQIVLEVSWVVWLVICIVASGLAMRKMFG